MRSIEFRGKVVGTADKWVYGNYFTEEIVQCFEESKTKHYIGYYRFSDWGLNIFERFEVIPETVGQFTGKFDRNGLKVFEGDLIAETQLGQKIWEDTAVVTKQPIGVVVFQDTYWNVQQTRKGEVLFIEDHKGIGLEKGDYWEVNISRYDGMFTEWNDGNFEVIGHMGDARNMLYVR